MCITTHSEHTIRVCMRVQSGGVGKRAVGTVAMRIVDVHVYRNDGRGGGGERIVLVQVKGKVPEG